MYESIVKNTTVNPKTDQYYSDEDTIPECEYLAALYESREPGQLGTYGWKSPQSTTPIYRDEATWEFLYTEWGHGAPSGMKPGDLVPFNRSREYTQMKCFQRWELGYVAAIDNLIRGFRHWIDLPEFFKRIPDGAALKLLVEGRSEVDLVDLFAAARYLGNWTSQQKEVLEKAFSKVQEDQKTTAPISERPVNQLLHFFTGSYSPPPNGWKEDPAQFKVLLLDVDACAHLEAHTCFNQLFIPSKCLEDAETFANTIYDSIIQSGYNIA